jgi:hypothetical protein
MEKVVNSIPVQFSNYEKLSETVSKVKVLIMYCGVNRNGSYMSKEAVEKAIPSLYGCPIVGDYKQENFTDHGGKITIDSTGIKYEETTKPYGFVDLDDKFANVRWEEVEDADGNTKNYLVCDAYLWRKRYPELDIVFENGAWQSMELNVNEYKSKDDGYVDLTDFTFDALCILGKSDNADENVEPCFEEASIHSYSLKKDEFKAEFSAMMQEIRASITEEVVEVVEEDVVEETVEESVIEESVVEEFEVIEDKVESTEEIASEVEKTVEEPKFKKRNFELSYSQIVDEIYSLINTYDEEGWMNYEYWICETFTSYVIVRESESYDYYKLPYSVEDNVVSIGEKTPVYSAWLTADEKQALEDMKSEYSVLKEKESQLIQSQINSQKDELFEKYDEILLENEEYIEIKKRRDEFSVVELKSTLALLYVESNVHFSVKTKKSGIVELVNESKDSNPVADPYGGLFNLKK